MTKSSAALDVETERADTSPGVDESQDTISIGPFARTKRAERARLGLSPSRRWDRLVQIFGIVRKYDVLHGLTPVKFRRMLEELGPTFVKAGQILSMRSEILPEQFCTELAKLRSDVDPMPYETVIATLEQE